MKQRGCEFCLDYTKARDSEGKPHHSCTHKACPYKVLDKYETYDEFLASKESMILVPQFFEAANELIRMTNIGRKPVKMFSDVYRRWNL